MADRLEVLKAKYPSEAKAIMNKNYIAVTDVSMSIMANKNVAELYDLLNKQGLTQINKDGTPKKSWYSFGGVKNTRRRNKKRQTRKRS